MNPKYPVYIPPKNRFDSRITVRSLQEMHIPFYVVIEPQEYDDYISILDKSNILELPWSMPESSNELFKARNWIKEHSISIGAKRHWQLDDNIKGFERLNKNRRGQVTSGTIFRCAEDFVDRYENVAISGFEYRQFSGGARRKKPPFRLNARIYSCSLVNNSIPHKWEDVYNDDTDICIRVMKDGWCTVLFHCFIQNKSATMTISGGNTDIYQEDGRLKMAESLAEKHPDICSVVKKFNRWQHDVNYDSFKKNKLIRKEGLVIKKGVNNYGMIGVEV